MVFEELTVRDLDAYVHSCSALLDLKDYRCWTAAPNQMLQKYKTFLPNDLLLSV